MKTIWKYKMRLEDRQTLQLPIDAQIIKMMMHNREITLWAVIDPNVRTEDRVFEVLGTGWPVVTPNHHHIETFFDGPFLWHLFEVKP